jgi:hypothetical protein
MQQMEEQNHRICQLQDQVVAVPQPLSLVAQSHGFDGFCVGSQCGGTTSIC